LVEGRNPLSFLRKDGLCVCTLTLPLQLLMVTPSRKKMSLQRISLRSARRSRSKTCSHSLCFLYWQFLPPSRISIDTPSKDCILFDPFALGPPSQCGPPFPPGGLFSVDHFFFRLFCRACFDPLGHERSFAPKIYTRVWSWHESLASDQAYPPQFLETFFSFSSSGFFFSWRCFNATAR